MKLELFLILCLLLDKKFSFFNIIDWKTLFKGERFKVSFLIIKKMNRINN